MSDEKVTTANGEAPQLRSTPKALPVGADEAGPTLFVTKLRPTRRFQISAVAGGNEAIASLLTFRCAVTAAERLRDWDDKKPRPYDTVDHPVLGKIASEAVLDAAFAADPSIVDKVCAYSLDLSEGVKGN